MSELKEKLIEEVDELKTKVERLSDFISSDDCLEIPIEHQRLLGLQRNLMSSLVDVLNKRIKLLVTQENQSDEEEE